MSYQMTDEEISFLREDIMRFPTPVERRQRLLMHHALSWSKTQKALTPGLPFMPADTFEQLWEGCDAR